MNAVMLLFFMAYNAVMPLRYLIFGMCYFMLAGYMGHGYFSLSAWLGFAGAGGLALLLHKYVTIKIFYCTYQRFILQMSGPEPFVVMAVSAIITSTIAIVFGVYAADTYLSFSNS